MMSLEVVGHIDIPPAVLRHRFVLEAQAIVATFAEDDERREKVVGTANTGRCELYGWAPDIPEHVDNKGFVYLVALTDGDSMLYTAEGDAQLLPGTVVRLNDFMHHWTFDDAPKVCAFVGSFDEPQDDRAMQILRDGVAALARGDYYDAPRVIEGFRVLMDDECLVEVEAMAHEPWLTSDALVCGKYFELCALCDGPAVTLDNHWPYHQERNRCCTHRRES